MALDYLLSGVKEDTWLSEKERFLPFFSITTMPSFTEITWTSLIDVVEPSFSLKVILPEPLSVAFKPVFSELDLLCSFLVPASSNCFPSFGDDLSTIADSSS